jgi:hypothetical protein
MTGVDVVGAAVAWPAGASRALWQAGPKAGPSGPSNPLEYKRFSQGFTVSAFLDVGMGFSCHLARLLGHHVPLAHKVILVIDAAFTQPLEGFYFAASDS